MRSTASLPALSLAVFLSLLLHVNGAFARPGVAHQMRTWSVNGAELMKALEGKLDADAQKSELGRIASTAKGNDYIAGVADTTSGTAWCGAGSVLPHELTDRIYSYLRALPLDRLEENASKLVIEGLSINFPCRAN